MQTANDREIEVKFYLSNPEIFIRRLTENSATLVQPRVNEWNLRFDSPGNLLSSSGQVLRLRKDQTTRLTYKSAAAMDEDVTDRLELEVEVGSFNTMRQILETLGFTVFAMYEKFRTTWHWMDCEVTLDEMPYGFFCEVEGADPAKIKKVTESMRLNWDARILASYLGIFAMLKTMTKVNVDNLVFSSFENISISPADFRAINIHPGDG